MALPKQNMVKPYVEKTENTSNKVGNLVIDGVDYGKISEGGFNALKNNTLSSYTPLDDEEKETLNNFVSNYKITVTDSKGKNHGTISYNTWMVTQGKGGFLNNDEKPKTTIPTSNYSVDFVNAVKNYEIPQKRETVPPLIKQTQEELRKVRETDEYFKKNPIERTVVNSYINAERQYKKDELNKQLDPNGIAAKYGLDASTLTIEDLIDGFDTEDGAIVYINGSDYVALDTGANFWTDWFTGRKTPQVVYDLQYLIELANNNKRRENSKKDMGAWWALGRGFANGFTFGVSAMDSPSERRYKELGLPTEMLVGNEESFAKTYSEHPFAYGGGQIGGTVVTSMGVGGIVSGGLKAAGWKVGTATIAREATVQGITGALRGSITTASSGGDWGDIGINALREGLTGALGGVAGGFAEKGITKLLNNSKYATSTLGKLKNLKTTAYGVNAIGGITDATADYITDEIFVTVANNVFDANLQERTGKDLLTDFAVSLALGTAMNMRSNTKADVQARVEDVVNRYGAEFVKYSEQINGADVDTKIKAGEEFIEATNKFKKEINEQLFPGKAKEVETLHEMLDVAIDSTKMDLERTRKSKITESGVKTHHETDINYDVDLAISNIENGRATEGDFEHFKPGNTANRQVFYETTGIKLPEDSKLSNYILNALNNKEKRIHDIYLKHNANDLKQPDLLTEKGGYDTINEKSSLSLKEFSYVKEKTGWSDNVISYIRTLEEAEVYINAGLKEVQLGDHVALVRSDIDLEQVDSEGITNRERMSKGMAPYAKNGEKIELHHIGQENNSPLAELTWTEHRGKGQHGKLHNLKMKSKVDHESFSGDRNKYWKERVVYLE